MNSIRVYVSYEALSAQTDTTAEIYRAVPRSSATDGNTAAHHKRRRQVAFCSSARSLAIDVWSILVIDE